jgi:hypothetical protein
MYYHPKEEEGVLPFVKAIRVIAAISCLFALCLLIDFFLPEKCKEEVVRQRIYLKENNRFGGDNYDLKIVTSSFVIRAKPELFKDAPEQTRLRIYHSPVFGTIKSVCGNRIPSGETFRHEAELPIYRGYASFPISLLCLSLFTLFYKKDEVISYSSGVITVIILLTILMIF